jgi:hypothetical protein
MRYSVNGMSEYANASTRLGRALGATCILLAGTVPLGLALIAAIAAGLSDNPDATGPGDGAFVLAFAVMLGCTALAALVALEPALRSDLGRWWFGASVLALVPIYPAVAFASVLALRGNGNLVVGVAFILLCGGGYVCVWAAGARWIGRRRAAAIRTSA